MLNAVDVTAHYAHLHRTQGKAAADRYLSRVNAIVRIETKPRASLVESALHMANVGTFNAMQVGR